MRPCTRLRRPIENCILDPILRRLLKENLSLELLKLGHAISGFLLFILQIESFQLMKNVITVQK